MTYNELVQAVKDYLHRSDVDALVPTWVEVAEQRIYPLMRTTENEDIRNAWRTTPIDTQDPQPPATAKNYFIERLLVTDVVFSEILDVSLTGDQTKDGLGAPTGAIKNKSLQGSTKAQLAQAAQERGENEGPSYYALSFTSKQGTRFGDFGLPTIIGTTTPMTAIETDGYPPATPTGEPVLGNDPDAYLRPYAQIRGYVEPQFGLAVSSFVSTDVGPRLLAAYPGVFLYATLIEAYSYTANNEQRMMAKARFEEELELANAGNQTQPGPGLQTRLASYTGI